MSATKRAEQATGSVRWFDSAKGHGFVTRDDGGADCLLHDQNDDLTTRGTEDSIEGKTDNLKGKVKDASGGATGDTSKQAEGKFDQLKGKAKDTLGKGERKLDE